MRHRYLLFCLILSGFAGLSYELLWVRLLGLSFGTTTLSFSTVLAVFFGGLALGSWIAGRRAQRIKRPVRAYALIELVTGVFGLLLYPLLVNLGDFFADIDPGPGIGGALVRLAFATPLLIIPTVLMGATLPIVSIPIVKNDEDVGRATAYIYGFNTLGAFLGAYLVTFHILPSLGIFTSILVTAIVNVVVAVIALYAEHRSGDAALNPMADAPPAPPLQHASPELSKIARVGVWLTFFGGFAAICLQVVWVRLFATFLEGTIYGVGSVLVAVLVGIALGSMLIARPLRNSKHPGLWFALLQIGTLGSTLLFFHYIGAVGGFLRTVGRDAGHGMAPVHWQLVVVFVSILLPTLCSGAAFPTLLQLVERRATNTSRSLGSMYAANTVGSILGSVLTGFVLIPLAGSEATAQVGLALVALTGAVGAFLLATSVPRVARLALAAIAVAGLSFYQGFELRGLSLGGSAGAMGAFGLTDRELAAAERNIIYFSEGRSAIVTVFGRGKSRGLQLNGLGQGARNRDPPHHIYESMMVGLMPLIHVPKIEHGFVVGLGAGVTVDLLLQLGVPKITVAELEEDVIEAVELIFPEGESPTQSERVDIVVNDARHLLRMRAEREGPTLDFVTSMPAHPWVAAPIFTQEFFETARDNLRPGGVLSVWFGVGKMDAESVKSLLRGFTNAFDHYVIYFLQGAGAYYLVGGDELLKVRPNRIDELIARPVVSDHQLETFEILASIYASGTKATPKPPDGIVNTDDSAFVEVHAPRSSTTSPMVTNFLPAEYLLPDLVETDDAPKFYVALLEQLLGSPGGDIPVVPHRTRLPKARSTLAGVRDVLPESVGSYFEGRIALLRGQRAAARRALEESIAAGEDPLVAGRAARFLALLAQGEDAQARALAALPPTGGTLAKLFDLDPELARTVIPERPVRVEAEPIIWFLQRATKTSSVGAADLTAFEHRVGPKLAKSNRLGILDLCIEFAARNDLEPEGRLCANWRQTQALQRMRQAVAAARSAGARRRFETSAAKLEEARRFMPLTDDNLRLLLRSYVELDREAGIESVLEELRFRGWSEAQTTNARKVAEDEKKASKPVDDDKDEAPEPEKPPEPGRAGSAVDL